MISANGDVEAVQVSTVQLQVPSLGTIKGLCYNDKTCQYLGIPYAAVPGRFRRPQPASPFPNGAFDGTRLGPYCPQPPRDFYPIPTPQRPWLETPGTSETDCLNLNISVPCKPETLASNAGPLPVMVFLHGGAFAYAAGSAAIYDGRELASISVDEDTPTIVITINYRLGVYGFLASNVIRGYNAQYGEHGVGNYGLWDQVEALRWVQRHISGFGGDPSRVTLFGQSAGGVSTNLHLLRNEALFSSAILQSGVLPLCGIMTVDEYDVVYKKTLSVLGIPEALTPEEQLERLLKIPESALTASMVEVFMVPVVTLSPCDDGHILPSPMPSFGNLNFTVVPKWCPRIMIGDAASETVIWGKSFRSVLSTPKALLAHATMVVGAEAAKTLLCDIYSLNLGLDEASTFEFIEKFTSDAIFLAPNWEYMEACRISDTVSACFAYHFDEPSPYVNEWGGRAHHSLENVFIWSVLRHTLPPQQREQSVRMAKMWLQFANGISPWGDFKTKGDMMIFGSPRSGDIEMKSAEEDSARGYARWRQIRESNLLGAWTLLVDDICMRRRDLVDINASPVAMEGPVVGKALRKADAQERQRKEPGVL